MCQAETIEQEITVQLTIPRRPDRMSQSVLLWDGSAIESARIVNNRLKLTLLPQTVPVDDHLWAVTRTVQRMVTVVLRTLCFSF